MSKVAAIPPHIPAERVYDFDFFDGATRETLTTH